MLFGENLEFHPIPDRTNCNIFKYFFFCDFGVILAFFFGFSIPKFRIFFFGHPGKKKIIYFKFVHMGALLHDSSFQKQFFWENGENLECHPMPDRHYLYIYIYIFIGIYNFGKIWIFLKNHNCKIRYILFFWVSKYQSEYIYLCIYGIPASRFLPSSFQGT